MRVAFGFLSRLLAAMRFGALRRDQLRHVPHFALMSVLGDVVLLPGLRQGGGPFSLQGGDHVERCQSYRASASCRSGVVPLEPGRPPAARPLRPGLDLRRGPRAFGGTILFVLRAIYPAIGILS